jgi:hypothetical protein
MVMRASDVRRWIAGFEAAAAADRQTLRTAGADVSQSVELARGLIAAAWRLGWRPDMSDPARDREAEAVRETWAVLRRRLRR